MMLCEAPLTMRAIVVVLLLSCVEGKNEITIYNQKEVATGMSKTQMLIWVFMFVGMYTVYTWIRNLCSVDKPAMEVLPQFAELAEGPRRQNKSVQGPVMYTRWRNQPRFQPLAEGMWGAW